ncbi:MAG: right-handed parallel beta-helix repeat-containing protein, partial [Planctomycetota bacterium]
MSGKTNLRNWRAISVFLILFGGTVSMGATIYVDNDGPADFSDIQAAIDAAENGETIVVRDGVYTGDGNRDIDFKGKAVTLCSQNGPANCIIDCGGSKSDQHMGFYFHSAEGPDSVVDGFTITNGYHEDAGAILCTYVEIRNPRPSNPTIIRCVITNNRGTYAGAIRCKSHCEPLISNCVISGNIGTYTGGISYADESRPVVTACIIRGNSGTSGGGLRTGGARCHGTILNCVISGNHSTSAGAGICWWSWGGSVEIINCTIVDNEDELWSAGICIGGGGGTSGTITNCIIWGNRVQGLALEQIYLWPDGDLPATAEVTYCDVEGGWPGEGNIDEDPLFVDGDGPDNIIGTEDDNLHLLDGSSCLDAGDNSAVTPGLTTDLDGNARIMNATVDMGAYEGPQQGFVLSSRSVQVPEGGTNTFTVALAMDPLETVKATVAFESGDPDITIELGSVLIFDSSNYSEPQTVILGAAE